MMLIFTAFALLVIIFFFQINSRSNFKNDSTANLIALLNLKGLSKTR